MQLSRVERWILHNQCKILEALDSGNKEQYKELQEALEWGYSWHYDEYCPVCRNEDMMSEEECREVVAILELHRRLKWLYDALPDSEKKDIDPYEIAFHGFDGNEETKQMAYAKWFCNRRLKQYEELQRPEGFNSHAPVLRRYRAMLREWEKLGKKLQLTKEEIMRIVAAGRLF